MSDRRPLIPLEASLADLASGLLPGGGGSEPAAWTSWALRDQSVADGFSYWETPIVDGDPCNGDGVGFPEAPADTTPITIDDVTSAAAAGWPHDAGPGTVTRSWVSTLAGIGLESTEVTAAAPQGGVALSPLERGSVDHGPDLHAEFLQSDVRDAMFLHPSASRPAGPERNLDGVTERATQPVAPQPIDVGDFTARLERGASLAMTEPHLHTLAARALDRLAPRGTSAWLTEHPSGRLSMSLTNGDGRHAGCGVVDRRSCPAIATGVVQRFDRSDELDACPHLLAANLPPCAATCVPVAEHGPLRGVLFVSVPAPATFDDAVVTMLQHTASTIARRVAEVRATMSTTDSD